MIQFLSDARAWLTEIGPWAPGLVLVLAIWLPQYLMRRLAPKLWEWAASPPFLPASSQGAWRLLRKAWQAAPSAALGAFVTALTSGGDSGAIVWGALVGLLAPAWHEFLKALPFVPYTGETRPSNPSGPAVMMLALSLAGAATQACAGANDSQGALIERGTALALSAATEAVNLLDRREAEALARLEKPTPEQLAAAEARVKRLERAAAGIRLARAWLEGKASEADGMAALKDSVEVLKLTVSELEADGVVVPPAVKAGLLLAERL